MMYHQQGFLLLVVSLAATTTTTTLAFQCPRVVPKKFSSSSVLWAATKKRKNKPKSRTKSGGGFGSSNTKSGGTTLASGLGAARAGAGTKVLRKAANTFDDIRKRLVEQEGKSVQDCCRDVYVRSPLDSPTTFWFVGKIAREAASASDQELLTNHPDRFFGQSAVAQKRVILEYAKDQLRPQNMGGRYASALELWLAPGDSEMDVATNKITLHIVQGSLADLPDDFDAARIGYNPEIYVGDERTDGGLRVERDEHGVPTKPVFDVNESVPTPGAA